MMKILLLLLAICQFPYISAQRYSLLDGNAEWVYYTVNQSPIYPLIVPRTRFYRYYTTGEQMTLPDGKLVTLLFGEVMDVDGNLVEGDFKELERYGFDLGSQYRAGFLMEKDGKTYGWQVNVDPGYNICDANGVIDSLLQWDMDWQSGQKIYYRRWDIYNGRYSDPINYREVVSRSYVTMADGSSRILLKIKVANQSDKYWRMQPGYYMAEIIDGIGCINGQNHILDFLQYADYMQIYEESQREHYSHLIMFRQNDEVVYIAPREDPDAQAKEEYTTFKPMPFYPNITPESVKDGTYNFDTNITNSEVLNPKPKRINVYDISGRQKSDMTGGLNIANGKKVFVK